MKNRISLGLLFAIATLSVSCLKPRITPDYSIYGDKAFIKSITTFKYIEVTNNLNYNTPVTGDEIVNIKNKMTTDTIHTTISVITNVGTDLTQMGIRLINDAQKIEPINGAPVAGLIGDYSKGPYVYRVYSADGTVRDWSLTFTVSPVAL
jgi:hypothetical protein